MIENRLYVIQEMSDILSVPAWKNFAVNFKKLGQRKNTFLYKGLSHKVRYRHERKLRGYFQRLPVKLTLI